MQHFVFSIKATSRECRVRQIWRRTQSRKSERIRHVWDKKSGRCIGKHIGKCLKGKFTCRKDKVRPR